MALHVDIPLILALAAISAGRGFPAVQQFPAPPSHQSLIYIEEPAGVLSALPFEAASTPIKANSIARSDKVSYIELKGARAVTLGRGDAPRFFLFVADQPGVHPPFLVRFVRQGDRRRVTAITQRGQNGFAIWSEEIIKPLYRVLSRSNGFVFMELEAREPLSPGEYGFVGADITRVATFHVGG